MPYAIPPVKVRIEEATFSKVRITPEGEGVEGLIITDYTGTKVRICIREDGLLVITPANPAAHALRVTDYTGAKTRVFIREDGILDTQLLYVGGTEK